MSVIRTHKNKSFTIIDNRGMKDEKLSLKAKGLLAYLLTLPDDWKIYVSELQKHSRDGRDSIRAAINELIENGYLKREETRDERGVFSGVEYHVYESGIDAENPATENPATENPKAENPKAENPSLLNTDITKDLDIQKTDNNMYVDKSKKRFKKPTIDEVSDYCKERGNTVSPQRFIDHYESNGWKVGKNPMRDWKAAVRTWERNNFHVGKKASEKQHNSKWAEQMAGYDLSKLEFQG